MRLLRRTRPSPHRGASFRAVIASSGLLWGRGTSHRVHPHSGVGTTSSSGSAATRRSLSGTLGRKRARPVAQRHRRASGLSCRARIGLASIGRSSSMIGTRRDRLPFVPCPACRRGRGRGGLATQVPDPLVGVDVLHPDTGHLPDSRRGARDAMSRSPAPVFDLTQRNRGDGRRRHAPILGSHHDMPRFFRRASRSASGCRNSQYRITTRCAPPHGPVAVRGPQPGRSMRAGASAAGREPKPIYLSQLSGNPLVPGVRELRDG